jgi:hypothetical protein
MISAVMALGICRFPGRIRRASWSRIRRSATLTPEPGVGAAPAHADHGGGRRDREAGPHAGGPVARAGGSFQDHTT